MSPVSPVSHESVTLFEFVTEICDTPVKSVINSPARCAPAWFSVLRFVLLSFLGWGCGHTVQYSTVVAVLNTLTIVAAVPSSFASGSSGYENPQQFQNQKDVDVMLATDLNQLSMHERRFLRKFTVSNKLWKNPKT
jgi:hypothetical protein